MSDISYNKWVTMSDEALMKTIGSFVRHHRLNQNKSQDEVAQAAGISRSTLSLMERGGKIALNSLIQVLRILDLLYIMDVFKVVNEISPIEYAKLQKGKRKRASKSGNAPNSKEGLGW
jgi:transcriptional regulator with XRE-family HTH domain